jgi:hypothetical protein
MYMLDREDMLELSRRMTPARTCFDRIAGSYRDEEGYDNGSFNTHFLKLNPSDKVKNLAIAKSIPYSKTNVELKEYTFPGKNQESMAFWKLLMALNECELKNDAMLDTFYDIVSEKYQATGEYAICVFHGAYDIPVKAKDKEWMEGSEEVYSFLICAICPVNGDYELGKPECGFLFPSFNNRCSDQNHIAVFNADPDHPHDELINEIFNCR